MTTLENEAAIRRAVAHLSKTCSSHGHHKDLYAALEIANPDLARRHWESLGRDAETAGIALGLKMDDEGDVATTVLDAYLFGDSTATLDLVARLSEMLSGMSAHTASGKFRTAIVDARVGRAKLLGGKPR